MSAEQYGISIKPLGLPVNQANLYSSQVREYLRWIEKTKMGKILLNSIKWYGKPIEIRPYTVGDCNATADMELVPPSGLSGVFDAIATLGQSQVKGIVNYSPKTWSKHGTCQPAGMPRVGEMWDEVLFHELVHAFRYVSGKLIITGSIDTRTPLYTGLVHYTDNEEFYAVMLQNIYYADRTNKIKTYYRGAHVGGWPLDQQYVKPWGFFSESSQVFDLVEKFCQDHKGLSKRVATDLADAVFNPLSDYYADREKARAISKAALTVDLKVLARDMIGWAF